MNDKTFEITPETLALSGETEAEDLFAGDFFSQPAAAVYAETVDAEFVEVVSPPPSLWSAVLPRVSRAEISESLIFSSLNSDFSGAVCSAVTDVLTRIFLRGNAAASCSDVLSEECDLGQKIQQCEAEQNVFISFAVEPSNRIAVVVLDSSFAVEFITRTLGGDLQSAERRYLSSIELTVLEFCALNCLKGINDSLHSSLFRMQTVAQTPPIDLTTTRGLLHKVTLQLGKTMTVVQMLLPMEFLHSLSQAIGAVADSQNLESQKNLLKKAVSGAPFHLVIGETQLSARDLSVLEAGDVVLIERVLTPVLRQNIRTQAQIRIADETAGCLFGDLSTENFNFTVRQIDQSAFLDEPKRLFMVDNETSENLNEDAAENGLALEKVVVKIAVELVSRRINLDEIASLRVGQIIDLGCQATDPVELVCDGKTVAVGQLIEIENGLGVRLTRTLL